LVEVYKLPRSFFDEGLPTLPAVCFVDRTIGAEFARFFLTIADFKVTTSSSRKCKDFGTPLLSRQVCVIASHTRRVSRRPHSPPHLLQPQRHCNSEVVETDVDSPPPRFYRHDPALKRSKKYNAANSQLLLWSYFKKVKRLELIFLTPTVAGELTAAKIPDMLISLDSEWMWPIDDFLQNFAQKSVLQLAELRSVTVVAKSANKEEDKPHLQHRKLAYPYSSVENEKLDQLQVAVGLERQLKDGFDAVDREVALQVRFRHIRKCEDRSWSEGGDCRGWLRDDGGIETCTTTDRLIATASSCTARKARQHTPTVRPA
jgi:hypothetical protein